MCDSTGFFVYNYSSVNTDMGKDKRGISRGKCSICECEEYESSALRCDYCGHTPIDHLPFGSEPKRPRTEEPQLEENEVVENPLPVQNVQQPEESAEFIESPSNDVSTESEEAKVDECKELDEVLVTSVETQFQAPSSNTDSVDTAVQTLQKQIDALTREKEGVEINRFEISRKNGKIVAYCNVCTTAIAMGEPHHGLNFVKQHKASQTHKTNFEIANAKESEIPSSIRKIQEEIEKNYPRVFLPRKKSLTCRICNTELLLSHKVALNNVHQHANSASHRQKASKSGAQGSKDILFLFTKQGATANKTD